MNERIIAHVDMDAFFASLEVMANPSLAGKPVLVCGSLEGRGSVVTSATYEARPSGVRAGMSIVQAKRLCPRAVLVESHFGLYTHRSLLLQETLLRFTPVVEPCSVDEAFLDLSDRFMDFKRAEKLARELKREVKKRVGVPCTIGIAPNRMLAKLGSDRGKPDGLLVIHPENILAFLDPLPAGAIWGIGSRTAEMLGRMGVKTLADLRAIPQELLTKTFGKGGEYLYRAARGIDDAPVVPIMDQPAAKSIGHEVTLQHDLGSTEQIIGVLSALCDRVAVRLREGGFLAELVTVKLRDSNFKTLSRRHKMLEPTDYDLDLFAAAEIALGRFPAIKRGIRLVGVTANELMQHPTCWQPTLFQMMGSKKKQESEKERLTRLSGAMDELRKRFGKGTIKRARTLK
jgi:DNA polymerase IV